MAKWGWWNPVTDRWEPITRTNEQSDREIERIREQKGPYGKIEILMDEEGFILVMDTESKNIDLKFWMCVKGDSS